MVIGIDLSPYSRASVHLDDEQNRNGPQQIWSVDEGRCIMIGMDLNRNRVSSLTGGVRCWELRLGCRLAGDVRRSSHRQL